MSNLIIDEGNTRCKLAIVDNGRIVDSIAGASFSDEPINHFVTESGCSRAISCSVRREPENINLPPNMLHIRLSHTTPLPISIDYKTPSTLGPDRIAAAVGAWQTELQRNVLIIDAGTAITIDFLRSDGVFMGGIISAGAAMRTKALNHFTGCLPLVSVPDSTELIGTTTAEAIGFGVVNGVKFEVEGYIRRFRQQFGNVGVIVTGGEARLLTNIDTDADIRYEPDLVIIGLNTILEQSVI